MSHACAEDARDFFYRTKEFTGTFHGGLSDGW